jgi:probable rRNA maturation factor
MGDKLQIDINWRPRTDWHAVPLLRRVARFVAQAEGFRAGTLSISVVGRRAMTTLHSRSLGLAEPTDVLSVDYGTNRRCAILDGEIVLCADVALQRVRAMAKAHRRKPLLARSLLKPARAELALYLTHGLLHLAGYDDHTAREFERMHRREDELLSALGLGPLFQSALGAQY